MGEIISDDATRIDFPSTCDILVDDVEQCSVHDMNTTARTMQGTFLQLHRFKYFSGETRIYGKRVKG